jgi:hypothetical protein
MLPAVLAPHSITLPLPFQLSDVPPSGTNPLPVELLSMIVNHVAKEEPTSLPALLRTSKQLYDLVVPVLYKTIPFSPHLESSAVWGIALDPKHKMCDCCSHDQWPNKVSTERKLAALAHATAIRIVDFDHSLTSATYDRWRKVNLFRVSTIVWTWSALEKVVRVGEGADSKWASIRLSTDVPQAVERVLEVIAGQGKKDVILSVPSATAVDAFVMATIRSESKRYWTQNPYIRGECGLGLAACDALGHADPDPEPDTGEISRGYTMTRGLLCHFGRTLANHPSTATLSTHQDVALPFLINGFDMNIPIHFHGDCRAPSLDKAFRYISKAVFHQNPYSAWITLVGMKPFLNSSTPETAADTMIERLLAEAGGSNVRASDGTWLSDIHVELDDTASDCSHLCRL